MIRIKKIDYKNNFELLNKAKFSPPWCNCWCDFACSQSCGGEPPENEAFYHDRYVVWYDAGAEATAVS